ncbi:hypothetical protein KAR48_18750 [bacterium]|nr:hypothetical protein [bacterium]
MTVVKLKKITEELGLSPDDTVHFYVKGCKGIIEFNLVASDREIELSTVNDVSEDYLSEEELNYYFNLDEK